MVVVICISLSMFHLFFKKNPESSRLKKASFAADILFLLLVEIGLVGLLDQHINLVLPNLVNL